MKLLRGQSLSQVVKERGRLGPSDVRRILTETGSALWYAAKRNVVHRDIKPENILLSAGHAVVADFGIAKAISVSKTEVAGQSDAPSLTQLGASLGTPAYMSPEQAAGEPDLDGRSDIYSLGCVLYEMLSGRQPFTGPSAAAVIAKRFMEIPAPLRTIDSGISLGAELVVSRALEREPSDRFASATDFLHALVAAATTSSGPQRVSEDKPSVAVLPFTNVSSNADDEYFSDGMTDEVISALAHLPNVRVAARTSTFVFKGQRVDLRQIAQQLHVQTVLEGSVRRAGSRVRISVQLVAAADGLHLWSERYDRELADVFAMQDEIAQTICAALEDRFGRATAPTQSRELPVSRIQRAPVDPAAYDVYLRGRFFFEKFAAIEAMTCFEQAIALDPDFALAHAGYAWTNLLAPNINLMRAVDAYPRARAAADRALALQPDLPEALLAHAFVAWWFEWDDARAETLVRKVMTLAPALPNAHELYGLILIGRGSFKEGIRSLEHSRALDPLSDLILYDLAFGLYFAGEPTRAIDVLQPVIARSIGIPGAHFLLGAALFVVNRLPEARAAVERGRDLAPPNAQYRGALVCVLAAMGDTAVARQRLHELEELAERGAISAVEVACGYHWLGDDDAAFAWLERAYQARELWMTFLHLEPRLQGLRTTPRFEALVQRIGVASRTNS
jgi:TolB-like protein/Flp pilus assembly protein TadD